MKLNELHQGQWAKVVNMGHLSHRAQKKLMSLGLLPDTDIQLVRFASFGDPLQVQIHGTNLVIRAAIAQEIGVQVIEK